MTSRGVRLCLAPIEEGDERDEGYCEMYEASECPVPCATCYFAPCEHGKTEGCLEPCEDCPHVCCDHWGVNGKTGEIYRGCMGPGGEDSKSCPCEKFHGADAPSGRVMP